MFGRTLGEEAAATVVRGWDGPGEDTTPEQRRGTRVRAAAAPSTQSREPWGRDSTRIRLSFVGKACDSSANPW